MKRDCFFSQSVFKALVTCILLCTAAGVSAQNAMDFSGSWVIDHAKSAAEFRDYDVTCNIIQTPATFSVEQVFLMKDGKKTSMKPIVFSLDGKESATEEQGGTNKVSAEWSEDHKTLITKYVRTMNGNNYGSITTYAISADGRVLTVKSSDLTGESPMVQVYNKK